MSIHDFWHEDMDLIYAYEKAYYNDMYQRAYIYGAYNEIAYSIAYSNAWKNGRHVEYCKEIKMRDMIDELNEKQAERSIKYREYKKKEMSIKYQKQNLYWI